MKKILATACTSLALLGCGGREGVDDYIRVMQNVEVVNGIQTDISDVPSTIVMITDLGNKYSEYCTGSLWEEDTFITAAHCLKKGYGDLVMIYGANDINSGEGTIYEIADARMHENYSPGQYDIGLVLLKEKVVGAKLAKILQPENEKTLPIGEDVLGCGFGETSNGDSGVLYCGEMPVMALYALEMEVGDSESAGLCYGDSGGPEFKQVYADGEPELRLTGVTSRLAEEAEWQCGRGAIVTLPGSYELDGWLEDNYQDMKNPPQEVPAGENHTEPFVMLDDTRCSYSGGKNQGSGLEFLLGAAALVYMAGRRKK